MAIRLGLIQMNCGAERKVNLDRAESFIRQAAKQGAQVILLPEVFHDSFAFTVQLDRKGFDLSEAFPGPITNRMQALAKELGIVVVAPFYERVERSVYYCSAAVFDADGKLLGLYRKNHITLTPQFFEKIYFKPGNLGYPVFNTAFGKVGVLICHDRHYPEGARALGLHGAEVVLVPIAGPTASPSVRVWEKELAAHAIFNEYFVAGVNRVGPEGPFTYYGRSVAFDPAGESIGQASDSEEEVLLVDCDLDQITERRRTWQFYRDRRPDTYGSLTQLIP